MSVSSTAHTCRHFDGSRRLTSLSAKIPQSVRQSITYSVLWWSIDATTSEQLSFIFGYFLWCSLPTFRCGVRYWAARGRSFPVGCLTGCRQRPTEKLIRVAIVTWQWRTQPLLLSNRCQMSVKHQIHYFKLCKPRVKPSRCGLWWHIIKWPLDQVTLLRN